MADKVLKKEQEKFLNGWIKCKDLSEMTPKNIFGFCVASQDECGEYPECCYSEIIKEVSKMKNTDTDKIASKHVTWETKVFDFRTGEVVDWEDL